MVPQQYCLRWKHHHTNVQNMFAQLLEKERFCDVTLYCSPNFATQVPNQDTVDPENIRGVSLRAHRVVLAACSELLGALLGAHEAHGEPVLVIDGAEPRHLKALLDYMYTGEMNVHHSQLASLLKTAEELRIKGLTDIRWNNKDEPPDCQTGAVTTQSFDNEKPSAEVKQTESKHTESRQVEQEIHKNREHEMSEKQEKFNVNGGPPPLIKLPTKPERTSPMKRDFSDNESNSPKRRRIASGTDCNEEDINNIIKMEREAEWQHGNMDITAERVVGWCGGGLSTAGAGSEDEWADAPTDIGCFLRTRLTVDGDNSGDEESDEGAPPSTSSSAGTSGVDMKDPPPSKSTAKVTVGPKSGPTDHRFKDVVKLNDYLRHGRRPQFWEENYVKRVMEAVRIKELEMKQAAEILGVSYGTLYGRYRDVFGCINRPYRTARDFWQAKGPSELLERLQRGEISLDAGAKALGVSASHLVSYMADIAVPIADKDIPMAKISTELECERRRSSETNEADVPIQNSSSDNVNDPQQCDDQLQTLKRKPKTSAESPRESRAEKEALKNNANENLTDFSSITVEADIHLQKSDFDNEIVPKQCDDQLQTLKNNAGTPAELTGEDRVEKEAFLNVSDEKLTTSSSNTVKADVHLRNSDSDNVNDPQQCDDQLQTLKRKPKTLAESPRESRAEKEANENLTTSSSITVEADAHLQNSDSDNVNDPQQCDDQLETLKRKPKTLAENPRDCRVEKEGLQSVANENSTASSSITVETDVHLQKSDFDNEIVPKQCDDQLETLKRKPKTLAESPRDCQVEKEAFQNVSDEKLTNSSSITVEAEIHFQKSVSDNENDPQKCDDQLQTLKRKPKTPAERTRECRARKRALQIAENISLIKTVKKYPKTSAERTREYRARKKALENVVKLSDNDIICASSFSTETDTE